MRELLLPNIKNVQCVYNVSICHCHYKCFISEDLTKTKGIFSLFLCPFQHWRHLDTVTTPPIRRWMWASRCRWSVMSRAHPLPSCPGLKITNPSIRYQVSHPWLSFSTLIRGVICVFNFYVLTFKLIILNSILTVYIHVFTLSLY